MHANKREEIEEVRAGDIAAAIGLKETRTGDTLCDEDKPIVLEAMKFPTPVIDVAIEPKTKADQDKMGIALNKLAEEDPTFRVHTDAETGQTIISGHGRAAPRDHRRPDDARVQGRRQRGPPAGGLPRDRPQARREDRGEVHPPVGRQGPVRPRRHQRRSRPRSGHGFVFEDKIVGGSIPKEYIAPVEAGIKEALENGILAGFPMVDVKVELVYGSYHDVDSSEMAFKIAGSMAFKTAARAAQSGDPRAHDEGRVRDARRTTWATCSATSRPAAARSAA